ncbi:unnamed protein product [Rangifer tarandus platyrhynchus]|uniref:Uncharacterized protein n=1 Tax=Rangifer tarandus platyrhynchus TaxID=3082113 RepID=A0ABN8ZEL7_RANTA|nr:unnamed protein product [Rangifer tarandus platyrhynchus]
MRLSSLGSPSFVTLYNLPFCQALMPPRPALAEARWSQSHLGASALQPPHGVLPLVKGHQVLLVFSGSEGFSPASSSPPLSLSTHRDHWPTQILTRTQSLWAQLAALAWSP